MYTAVLSMNYPQRVLDLLAYYLLIYKTDWEVPGCNWMGNDCLFRENTASDKYLLWGLAGPSLLVTHMVFKKYQTIQLIRV